MRVGNGAGKRICGIGSFELRARQQPLHHGLNLELVGVSHANDGLLYVIWGVFRDFQARLRRGQQSDGACMPKLQRRQRIFGDKRLLNRNGMR